MKRVISRGEKSAVVRVTPSWWGRLFGRVSYDVPVSRDDYDLWCTDITRQGIPRSWYKLLDRFEVSEIPRAELKE